jgi:hypothetical protein
MNRGLSPGMLNRDQQAHPFAVGILDRNGYPIYETLCQSRRGMQEEVRYCLSLIKKGAPDIAGREPFRAIVSGLNGTRWNDD